MATPVIAPPTAPITDRVTVPTPALAIPKEVPPVAAPPARLAGHFNAPRSSYTN